MDGGDGSDEGEEEAGDGEEDFDAEEGDGVLARFLPNVSGLESGRGEEGDGLEMVDLGAKRVSGEGEGEDEGGERDGGKGEDAEEEPFVSEENLEGIEDDLQRGNTVPEGIAESGLPHLLLTLFLSLF